MDTETSRFNVYTRIQEIWKIIRNKITDGYRTTRLSIYIQEFEMQYLFRRIKIDIPTTKNDGKKVNCAEGSA